MQQLYHVTDRRVLGLETTVNGPGVSPAYGKMPRCSIAFATRSTARMNAASR